MGLSLSVFEPVGDPLIVVDSNRSRRCCQVVDCSFDESVRRMFRRNRAVPFSVGWINYRSMGGFDAQWLKGKCSIPAGTLKAATTDIRTASDFS